MFNRIVHYPFDSGCQVHVSVALVVPGMMLWEMKKPLTDHCLTESNFVLPKELALLEPRVNPLASVLDLA